jgi:hypothetical protein
LDRFELAVATAGKRSKTGANWVLAISRRQEQHRAMARFNKARQFMSRPRLRAGFPERGAGSSEREGFRGLH